MKTLIKLSFIVPIPLIIGITMCIIGNAIDNELIFLIGGYFMSIGLPITMVIIVIISLILIITGRINLKDTTKQKNTENVEDGEYEQIEEGNTSSYYNSIIKKNQNLLDIAEKYKNSSFKEKLFGWLFFAFLMIDFMLILVFLFINNIIGFIVCFSLFAGTILIFFIAKIIIEKFTLSGKVDYSKNQTILTGVVKSCTFSRGTSTGTRTTRLIKVVYEVTIMVYENKYKAYSEDVYEIGDKVKFLVRGKRYAKIIKKISLDDF